MAITVEELKNKAIELGQTGLNFAQTGLDKGVQLASAAKLKAANIKEDTNLRAAYAELGKMYFADHGAEPEEAYAAVCNQIADIQAAMAANNARIAEMKVVPAAKTEEEIVAEAEAVADEAEAIAENAPVVEVVEKAEEAVEEIVEEAIEEAAADAADSSDEAAPV